MKTFATGLAAHYASGNTTLAAFLEIERRDGVFLRFNGTPNDIVVDGDTYKGSSGLDISDLASSNDLSVDTTNLTVFPGSDTVAQADLVAGLWDFATYRLFETSYVDPTIGINVLRRGWLGEFDVQVGKYTVELRSKKQALQQTLGAVTSPTCRYKLGSTAMPDGLCTVDLAPFTQTDTLTAVDVGAPSRIFTCSADSNVDDYYGEGSCTALTGANAGYSRKVKDFAAGVFTLALAMPFAFDIGDTVSVVAGCRKRHERTTDNPGGVSDCKDKFNNVVNFGGEPHVPGADALTSDPDVS